MGPIPVTELLNFNGNSTGTSFALHCEMGMNVYALVVSLGPFLDFSRGFPNSDRKAGQAAPEIPAPGPAQQTRLPR